MSLRLLQQQDLSELARIAATAPDPWREQDLREALNDENRLCLVCVMPGSTELVGFACFRFMGQEGELEMIAVNPRWRTHGFGRVLVIEGITRLRARGVAHTLLEVRAGNTAARHLYERLGFRTIARRPGLYSRPPEDGYTMLLQTEELKYQ